ncbi:MAG: hydrogenase maturation nickel metallochaperone HypA [Chloroflexi bacterium]|nr:hydrogenase maturation nickel metallochaperone HypA [Chloroflexota bacterium]
MQHNTRLSAIIDHLLRRASSIQTVRLAVGELVSFTDAQIRKQWEESPFAHIPLTIRRVPAQQQCMTCFEKYQPKQGEVSCPQCGSVGAKILVGEEFFLEAS